MVKLTKIFKEDITDMIAANGPQEEAPITDISLDRKVDHFLIQYEKESIPSANNNVVKESKFSLKYLMEAPEDEELPMDEPTSPSDDPMADIGGNNDPSMGNNNAPQQDMPQTPVVQPPKINISTFSGNVARLIEEYATMLDPKRVILNRTRAYLEKNYNPAVAKEFLNILDVEYNISQESMRDKELNTVSPQGVGSLDSIENVGGGGTVGEEPA